MEKTIVRRNPIGRPRGEDKSPRQFNILKPLDEKLVALAAKTGDSMNKIVNDALAKYLLGAALVMVLFGSCKKEEPDCYVCQWVKQGNIVPNSSEERCGPDVQSWALTVRMNQPNFYPICMRKQ